MSPVSFVYIYGGNKYIEIDEDISIVLVDILEEEGCNKYRVDLLTDVRFCSPSYANKAGTIVCNGRFWFNVDFLWKFQNDSKRILNVHVISKF